MTGPETGHRVDVSGCHRPAVERARRDRHHPDLRRVGWAMVLVEPRVGDDQIAVRVRDHRDRAAQRSLGRANPGCAGALHAVPGDVIEEPGLHRLAVERARPGRHHQDVIRLARPERVVGVGEQQVAVAVEGGVAGVHPGAADRAGQSMGRHAASDEGYAGAGDRDEPPARALPVDTVAVREIETAARRRHPAHGDPDRGSHGRAAEATGDRRDRPGCLRPPGEGRYRLRRPGQRGQTDERRRSRSGHTPAPPDARFPFHGCLPACP